MRKKVVSLKIRIWIREYSIDFYLLNLKNVSDIFAEKPNYNVGSAVKLSFGKKEGANKSAAAVWKLSDDNEEDLINEDDLLDESDKIKPDATELKGKPIYFECVRFCSRKKY